jgi:glutaminase
VEDTAGVANIRGRWSGSISVQVLRTLQGDGITVPNSQLVTEQATKYLNIAFAIDRGQYGELGTFSTLSIGIGGMVGGGIFAVTGLTVDVTKGSSSLDSHGNLIG